VRVRGGLVERLRFFHTTGPAITRKRDLEGRAVRSNADLRVVSIEPLGEAMRLYDISTGTGEFHLERRCQSQLVLWPIHEYLDLDTPQSTRSRSSSAARAAKTPPPDHHVPASTRSTAPARTAPS
jgi:hypothetical protein